MSPLTCIKICLLFLSHTIFFFQTWQCLLTNRLCTLSLDHQLYCFFLYNLVGCCWIWFHIVCHCILHVYMKIMFEMHTVLPCDIVPDMCIKVINRYIVLKCTMVQLKSCIYASFGLRTSVSLQWCFCERASSVMVKAWIPWSWAWSLWKHRNGCVFDRKRPNIDAALRSANQERELWEVAGAQKMSLLTCPIPGLQDL
jgi:hypothetical protein